MDEDKQRAMLTEGLSAHLRNVSCFPVNIAEQADALAQEWLNLYALRLRSYQYRA